MPALRRTRHHGGDVAPNLHLRFHQSTLAAYDFERRPAGPPLPALLATDVDVLFAEPDLAPIDVCKTCHLVWFDRGEMENLTPRPPKTEPVPVSAEQRQAAAIAKVKAMAEEA